MKKPPNSYWDRRAQQRMSAYHRSAAKTIAMITSAYDASLTNIVMEIEKIFRTYGRNGHLEPDKAKHLLNQMVPNNWLENGRKLYRRVKDPRVKKWLLNRLNAPAYRARITRLQALKDQVYLQSKLIADAEIRASTAGYIDTISDAYYRTMFDVQRGLGVGFDFATMPTRVIETILKRPWSGEHYSKRVWDNTDTLGDMLNEVLTGGFMSGIGISKMSQQLQERMDVGKFAANRLIRTETTYMANAAEMESYEEAEIEQYQFIATLDNRTSPICQEHDLKIYNVKDAVPGDNMPPLHPFCRSTTRAYFGPETRDSILRRARNPETGKTYLVPSGMNYSEWKKRYVS